MKPHHTVPRVRLVSTVVRAKDQVSTDLGDETVILSLASNEYYSLKEVGTRIWELIQEPKTVKEVRDTILNEYDVAPEHAERELLAVLQEMADEGLIEVKNEEAR